MTARNPLAWALLAVVCICFSGVTFAMVRLTSIANEAKAAARQAEQASADSTRGLCAIRSSDQRQIHQTAVYLRRHPDGIPSLQLSRTAIIRSEAPLLAQIAALRDVTCP